jgi:hypothetical protein
VLNVFQLVPHEGNGGSGVPSEKQHHVDDLPGVHSHKGQRIRSDDSPSPSFGTVKILWSQAGSGRLNNSSMARSHCSESAAQRKEGGELRLAAPWNWKPATGNG